MTVETTLISRSGGKCELCVAQDELVVYEIPPDSDASADQCVLICMTCHDQIENPETMDANHWRCLNEESAIQHKDSNGAKLAAGDTVTLIKDLNVKGAGFTAKRGTAVRSISLVPDNSEHIEGRVNGQKIVILTQFVKKSN